MRNEDVYVQQVRKAMFRMALGEVVKINKHEKLPRASRAAERGSSMLRKFPKWR